MCNQCGCEKTNTSYQELENDRSSSINETKVIAAYKKINKAKHEFVITYMAGYGWFLYTQKLRIYLGLSFKKTIESIKSGKVSDEIAAQSIRNIMMKTKEILITNPRIQTILSTSCPYCQYEDDIYEDGNFLSPEITYFKRKTKITLEYDFTTTLIKCDSCGKEYKLGPFKPFKFRKHER